MGAGLFEGDRKAAWTALVHAHARVMTRLAADLDAAKLISLGSYDVLVQLSENGGKLRLKELVSRVVLSQPGLSRKVAKMETDGLVERLDDPADGRAVIVHITRLGRSALRRASVVHIAGIEREFTSQISDQEAAVLAAVFGRLEVGERTDDRNGTQNADRDGHADDRSGRDGGGPREGRGAPERRKAADAARRRRGGGTRGPGSRP